MASEEHSEPSQPPPAAPPAQFAASWGASMHAYSTGQHYMWPQQHILGPYAAAAIPYSAAAAAAMYQSGGFYPPAVAAGFPYVMAEEAIAAEAKGMKRKGSSTEKSGTKGSSGSGNDGSQSGEDSGSDASSEEMFDDANKDPSTSSKKQRVAPHVEGETCRASEPKGSAKGRSATKLPISAPGRAALPSTATNLNVDVWNSSPSAGSLLVRHSKGNPSSAMSHKDERELKREKRKQSNRESARRSRLRKQQECEDLARKVAALTSENSILKSELQQLRKACEEVEAENSRLMDEMGFPKEENIFLGLSMQPEPTKKCTLEKSNQPNPVPSNGIGHLQH